MLLKQTNLHQVSKQEYKRIRECLHSLEFPTHRTLFLAEDDQVLWTEPKPQSPGQHTLLPEHYQLKRFVRARKSFVVSLEHPSPALGKQFPNTDASPMHREQTFIFWLVVFI